MLKLNYVEILRENPQYFKQFSCKDLLFLNYDCPVKEKKVVKWTDHNYFYYVLTGQKIVHTPNRSWEFNSGSFSFVKKGACIVEQFFEKPFCVVAFVLPDSFIARFINENKNRIPMDRPDDQTDDLIVPINRNEMLEAFCESILPYFASQISPSEKLIELKFNELLLHILNNPDNAELISYMYAVASKRAHGLEQVMEANFSYNLSLDEYARLCNRSLSSFKRDFKAIFKTTPGRWLLNKRLNLAHRMIVETDKPIADILLECGFENQAHFSKAFKDRFAHPPLQYRKRLESIPG